MTFEEALQLLEDGVYGEDVRAALYNGIWLAYNNGGGGGGGSLQNLTINLPDGSAVVYNGTAAKTASIPSTATPIDGSVTTAKIDGNAVTTAKIDDKAVTTAKIDDLAVTSGKIANGAITSTKLGSGAVTTAKLGTGSVSYVKLDNSVTDIFDRFDETLDDIYNVKFYGAVGDGATDDTDALNLAFQACHFQRDGQGGVIFFPAGTYVIKSGYVEFFSNMHIVGVPGGTVLTYDSSLADSGTTTKSPMSLLRNHTEGTDREYGATSNVVIEGITFDAGVFPKKSTSLGIGHAQNIVVRNCVFKNQYTNTTNSHYIETNACKNVVIEDCEFYEERHLALNVNDKTSVDCLYCEYVNIDFAGQGNYGYWDPSTQTGYYYPDNTHCRDITIRNNKFWSYGTADHPNEYYGCAIGGHGTQASKYVRIYGNIFFGDWNSILSDESMSIGRRYTITANGAQGTCNYWSVFDNTFIASNTAASSSRTGKLPAGIAINTSKLNNFVYNNTFVNYSGLTDSVTDSHSAEWNNVNRKSDGTVEVVENLNS